MEMSDEEFKERVDALDATIDDHVLSHGWSLMGVFSSDDRPGFIYSVGRAVFDKVELFVSSDDTNTFGYLINELARQEDVGEIDILSMADKDHPLPVEGFNVEFRFKEIDPVAAEMNMALRRRRDLRAVQVIWPDSEGHYPDDDDYNVAYRQEVMS